MYDVSYYLNAVSEQVLKQAVSFTKEAFDREQTISNDQIEVIS